MQWIWVCSNSFSTRNQPVRKDSEHGWIKQTEILPSCFFFEFQFCWLAQICFFFNVDLIFFFTLPGKHSKGRRPADDGASERWYCCRFAWSSSCSASCSGAQLERASEWRRSGCDKMWKDVTGCDKSHKGPHKIAQTKPYQSECFKSVVSDRNLSKDRNTPIESCRF